MVWKEMAAPRQIVFILDDKSGVVCSRFITIWQIKEKDKVQVLHKDVERPETGIKNTLHNIFREHLQTMHLRQWRS